MKGTKWARVVLFYFYLMLLLDRNLYSKVSTENIEFEDLVTAERNAVRRLCCDSYLYLPYRGKFSWFRKSIHKKKGNYIVHTYILVKPRKFYPTELILSTVW